MIIGAAKDCGASLVWLKIALQRTEVIRTRDGCQQVTCGYEFQRRKPYPRRDRLPIVLGRCEKRKKSLSFFAKGTPAYSCLQN